MSKYPTISEALNFILKTENITTKDDLDKFCGGSTREKLYKHVQEFAPIHWSKIKDPKAYVRGYYERKLIGYKVFTPTKKEQFNCPKSDGGCIGCHISKHMPMPLEQVHKMMDEFTKNESN